MQLILHYYCAFNAGLTVTTGPIDQKSNSNNNVVVHAASSPTTRLLDHHKPSLRLTTTCQALVAIPLVDNWPMSGLYFLIRPNSTTTATDTVYCMWFPWMAEEEWHRLARRLPRVLFMEGMFEGMKTPNGWMTRGHGLCSWRSEEEGDKEAWLSS